MKNIIIVDDHTMFIKGLKLLLSNSDTYQVIAVAHNGLELMDCLEINEPDIILMDINMPVYNGYQTTLKLKKEKPHIKIVILSMLGDESSVQKLLEVGADGYLFKNADEEELFEALDAVSRGERYIAKEIRDRIRIKPLTYEMKLSSRELDIAHLIVEGLTNGEIAEKLFLSVRTVETHRKNILAKLNLKNTASLVKYMMDNKPFLD